MCSERSDVSPTISGTVRQKAVWRWISWHSYKNAHACWFRSANRWPIRAPNREVAALSEAMAELGLKTGTIVTRGEQEEIDVSGAKIQVVPAWRFLLDLPEP